MVKSLPARWDTLASGRSAGEGNGYPLQYSCFEYPMEGGGLQATVQRVAKSPDMTEQIHFQFLVESLASGRLYHFKLFATMCV